MLISDNAHFAEYQTDYLMGNGLVALRPIRHLVFFNNYFWPPHLVISDKDGLINGPLLSGPSEIK